MITKTLNSFRFALKGIATTWREESNFRIEVIGALLVIIIIFYFHFSFIESSLCILAITIVLSAEIINTAFEDLCNIVEPEYNEVVAKVKDTSSAFVLVSSFGAFALGVIVFVHHFIF